FGGDCLGPLLGGAATEGSEQQGCDQICVFHSRFLFLILFLRLCGHARLGSMRLAFQSCYKKKINYAGSVIRLIDRDRSSARRKRHEFRMWNRYRFPVGHMNDKRLEWPLGVMVFHL